MKKLVLIIVLVSASPGSPRELGPGDPLDRIILPDGFVAEVFCTGIEGADGLAFDGSGILFAAAETRGTVFMIRPDGTMEPILEDLRNPEGLAVDSAGNVWVCEDVFGGRLMHAGSNGTMTVVADSLQYPEGVALTADGDLLVTESSLEDFTFPPVYSRVSRITDSGKELLYSSLYLWSFSDIAVDDSGNVYVCNELSGYPLVEASVVRFDISTGEWNVFCRGLRACEGICFQSDGSFPLLVAEEDTGEGSGRISAVSQDGTHSVLASGFYNIEDVAVGPSGELYVSEDTTGMIILIKRD